MPTNHLGAELNFLIANTDRFSNQQFEEFL